MATQHAISVVLTARADQLESALKRSQSSIKQLETTIAGLQGRMRQTTPATTQMTSGLRGLGAASSGLVSHLAGLTAGYLGVQGAIRGTQAIFAAGMNVETQERAWKAIAGGTKQASEELAFLRTTADKVGISFTSLEQGYRQVAAASKGTALEGQATRDIFLAITQAAQQIGLSSQDVTGALRSIGQMMSTGVVQADELRNELGNRIPGVMNIAAKAMGTTTQAMRKQMEAGNLLTVDFIPNFARAMQRQFTPSMETTGEVTRTAGQEFARLGNVITEMSAKIARDSGLLDWAKNVAQGIADIGNAALRSREHIEQLAKQRTAQDVQRLSPSGTAPATTQDQLTSINFTIEAAQRQALEFERKLEALGDSQWPTVQAWRTYYQHQIDNARAAIEEASKAREALLKALESLPKPAVTLNPSALEAPDMSGFAEQSNRMKRAIEERDALTKAVIDLGKSLEGLEAPAEIVKKQLDFIEKGLQKFNATYKDLVTLPAIPTTLLPTTTTPLRSMQAIPRAPDAMRALFATSGARHGVDPLFLEAIAKTETNFNPRAVSPDGAQGLMQFMPATAQRYGLKDPFNAEQSIEAAAKYVKDLMVLFRNNLALVAAGYNAGEGAVKKYGNTVPPYPETQQYVPKVQAAYAAYRGVQPWQATRAQQSTAQQPDALLKPALELRAQLQGSQDAEKQVNIAKDYAEVIKELVNEFRTYTTEEDVATRTTELANIARQAAAGDADGLQGSLERLEESLGLSTVSMDANERALKSRRIEGLLAVSADEETTKGIMAQVNAYQADMESIEALKKHIKDRTQTMEDLRKIDEEVLRAEESLLRVDEQRGDAIADIIQSMRDGLPPMKDFFAGMTEFEKQYKRLQELGAGEGTLRLAQSLKERSTAEFQAIQDGAANLASSLEDTLIASLTRGGDAWKEFGRIAVEELFRIVLNATQFRQTLTELLTNVGHALLKIISGLSSNVNVNAGENLRGYGGPQGRQHGGPLRAGQRSVVGEAGSEFLVSAGRMRLVGLHGPEIIRPTGPAYVLDHQRTMTLLQTRKADHQPPMNLAGRAMGGSITTGVEYLVGERGPEAVMSLQGAPRGSEGQQKQRPIVVNLNVHGVRDAQSFMKSAAEVKRAAALALQDAQRSL